MWEIIANLGRYARSGFDADGWLWEIQRGDEAKRVLVEISRSALTSTDAGLPQDTRDAIATEGQSEVAKVLDVEEPPRVIVCTTSGCRALGPDELNAN
jgi:hypothetical protein